MALLAASPAVSAFVGNNGGLLDAFTTRIYISFSIFLVALRLRDTRCQVQKVHTSS
jgi:hypothetical protein